MKVEQLIFSCDAPGCRSVCTLPVGETDVDAALQKRGWAVVQNQTIECAEQFCPFHKPTVDSKPVTAIVE